MSLLRPRPLSGPLRDVEDDGEAGPPELIAHDRVGPQSQYRCVRLKREGDAVDVETFRVEQRCARSVRGHAVGRWRDG